MPYIASSRTSTGGITGSEPLVDQDVHRVAHQRELHEHQIAQQVDEPRSARARATLGVEDAQHRPELRVVARLEVERGGLEVTAHLDGVLVGEPVGRALVRHVRRGGEQRV